jgi:glycosyltransferase involved in cell wall biosynthesis
VRFLLVTVTDPSPASRAHLDALIASVGAQDRDVELVVVLRGGGVVPDGADPRVRVRVVEQPLATGLSVARNAALRYASGAGLLDDVGAVGFPDDDCAFVPGLLGRVEARLGDDFGVVAGPYAPAVGAVDWARFPRSERELTPRLCMKAVSSINVFLSAAAVRTVGSFDERLGLGAEYGASEDADYVLRALGAGYTGLWAPHDVLLLHEYKPARASRYYRGNVAVLAKHAAGAPRTAWLLLRCFAYGARLVLRRAITPREYGRGFAVAARMLRPGASRLPERQGA